MGEAIFTLPFPEYDIADRLQKTFLKKESYSIAVPFSRQQKFYDLLLFNGESKKCVAIQVKSSRTYVKHSEKSEFHYDSWLGYFDIEGNYSDFFFIYMTYPLIDEKLHPGAAWERKILVFNREEMKDLLANLQTKGGKKERFFSFGFDRVDDTIFGVRGFKHLENRDYTAHLLNNKLGEIKSRLT